MNKYIKYILAILCLIVFGVIGFNIFNGNDIVIDSVIYDFIFKNFIGDYMTSFMKMLTNIGDVLCIVVVTVLCMFLFKNNKIRASIVINLVVVTGMNTLLKYLFIRNRPTFNVLVNESGYSFPSGHSMISIVFYGYLIYLIYRFISNKKVKWLLISLLSIIIIIIGFSRIYLGVHYASDVIGGFCFGISYLIIYIDIVKKFIKEKL